MNFNDPTTAQPATGAIPEHQAAFTSLHVEVNLPSLQIEGKFPQWLDGRLLRNGPGTFEAGDDLLRHQFDGPAMFHRFGFRDGKVSYANRFCRSPMFAYIEKHHRLGNTTFGTPVGREIMQRLREEAARGDAPAVNPSVAFMEIAGDLYATTDGSTIPVRIEPDTLETLGPLLWDDVLQKQDCAGNPVDHWRMRGTTGHWHRHPRDGSAINYFVQPAHDEVRESYNFFRVLKGRVTREPIASIPTDQSAFIHAFSVTDRYIILPESPLRLDGALYGSGGSVAGAVYWRKDTPMYLHIIDLNEKRLVRTIEVRPSYVMHTVNAYEDGDEIVLDMAVYDDGNHVWELGLDPALRPAGGMFTEARAPELRSHGKPYRYRLNPNTGAVSETLIADVCVELTTVDYAQRNGVRYDRFYSTGIDDRPTSRFYNQLSSFNLASGDYKTYSVDKHYLGEPVFVPRPGRTAESDGVLLSVGLDGVAGHSYLLALDPATLEPIARALVPHAVPSGFHGYFIGSRV
jgi:beta,beta-carotene 9',10'-dioxygenase